MSATPEEMAVIEAAYGLRWTYAVGSLKPPPDSRAAAEAMLRALSALDASRAPKKPMSAEERWEQAIQASFEEARMLRLGGWNRPGITLEQFKAAEAAAWDRAVYECSTFVMGIQHQAILNRKGRCHETP